jgi:hypothetical protein
MLLLAVPILGKETLNNHLGIFFEKLSTHPILFHGVALKPEFVKNDKELKAK